METERRAHVGPMAGSVSPNTFRIEDYKSNKHKLNSRVYNNDTA